MTEPSREQFESKSTRELIDATEQLLRWQPHCSTGSSGDLRQKRLRAALDNMLAEFEAGWQARLSPDSPQTQELSERKAAHAAKRINLEVIGEVRNAIKAEIIADQATGAADYTEAEEYAQRIIAQAAAGCRFDSEDKSGTRYILAKITDILGEVYELRHSWSPRQPSPDSLARAARLLTELNNYALKHANGIDVSWVVKVIEQVREELGGINETGASEG